MKSLKSPISSEAYRKTLTAALDPKNKDHDNFNFHRALSSHPDFVTKHILDSDKPNLAAVEAMLKD